MRYSCTKFKTFFLSSYLTCQRPEMLQILKRVTSWEVIPKYIYQKLIYVSYVSHTQLEVVLYNSLVNWHLTCVPVTETVCRLSTCTTMLVLIRFQTLLVIFQTRMLSLYYSIFYQYDAFYFWTPFISSLK